MKVKTFHDSVLSISRAGKLQHDFGDALGEGASRPLSIEIDAASSLELGRTPPPGTCENLDFIRRARLVRQNGKVLFTTDNLFLSAEPNGRMSLREHAREWESFEFVDDSFTPPLLREPPPRLRKPMDRLSVLLLHHGRPHFETALALSQLLKDTFDVWYIGDYVHAYGREAALAAVGLRQHTGEVSYDVVIVITGELGLITQSNTMRRLYTASPRVRFLHDVEPTRPPGIAYLFGNAELAIVPTDTGFSLKPPTDRKFRRCRVLIQGNIENRRNYDLISPLADTNPDIDFVICGLSLGRIPDIEKRNVIYYKNLPELEFHAACASCDFIMPLINPKQHAQYFTHKMTSSVHVGYAYELPFLAHRALADIYHLGGLFHETDEELISIIGQLSTMTQTEYDALVQDLRRGKQKTKEKNLRNITAIISELR